MKDAVLEKEVINQEKGEKARIDSRTLGHDQWFRVRPALRWTLAVTVIALVALVAVGNTPHAAVMAGMVMAVVKLVPEYAQYLLNILAAAAVFAVFCHVWRKPRPSNSKEMVAA